MDINRALEVLEIAVDSAIADCSQKAVKKPCARCETFENALAHVKNALTYGVPKPCPFCGAPVEFNATLPNGHGYIQCLNRSCPIQPITSIGERLPATQAWNTRARIATDHEL